MPENGRIVRFFFRSRINDATFVILILFYVTLLPAGISGIFLNLPGVGLGRFYIISLASVVIPVSSLLFIYGSRMTLIKSDTDFLFHYGVESRRLFKSVFAVVLFLYLPFYFLLGLLLLIMNGSGGIPGWLYYIDYASITVMLVSVGTGWLFLERRDIIYIYVAMVLFFLSSEFGNPLSFASIYSGYALLPALSTIVFSLAVACFSFYRSQRASQIRMNRIISVHESEVGNPLSFQSKKGFRAFYQLNTGELQIARWKQILSERKGLNRLRTVHVLVVISLTYALAALLVFFANSGGLELIFFGLFMELSVLLLIILPIMASNTVAIERLWVVMSYGSPASSSRHILISRSLFPVVTLFPMFIFSIYGLIRGSGIFGILFYCYIDIFPATVLMVYISAILFTPQIRDDSFASQISPGRVLVSMPVISLMVLSLISLSVPSVFFYTTAAFYSLLVLLILPGKTITAPVNAMIRRGYV